MKEYLDTFFYLWKNDESFRNKIINGKGFCLPHFGDLCEAAGRKLSDKEKQEFYDGLLPVMEANMQRSLRMYPGWWKNSITEIRTPTGRTPKMPSSAACRN